MKFLVILLLVASASAWHIDLFGDEPAPSLAQRQATVLKMLYHVNDPLDARFTDLVEAAANFDPTADTSIYTDGGKAAAALKKDVEDHRTLEKHHYFSLFNDAHRHDAIALFEVFRSCKTWSCGKNNGAYFRERLNEGAFVYAAYVSIIHNPLAKGIVLPPLYEITPHMFTNSEIINKAYSAKMTQTPGKFHMDFTGSAHNKEQRVAYFGEDIGLGVHHVTWHMDFPFWWKDSYGHDFDRKGELFFWVHHQLTARFDAERLSNYLDTVDELQWNKPIADGFAPHTTYKYGGEFPARPDNVDFEDVDGVARIRDMIIMEQRIRDAIAHGYVEGSDGKRIDIRNEHGIDVLGDIIESSTYSANTAYYGALHNLAHIILGRQGDPHGKFNQPPGVMEHFETATRDPSFFRLHKYMDNIFKEHKDSLPSYTAEEIAFPGVAIDKLSIGKLETFFENFEFSLAMAVDHSDNVDDVAISAEVSRLNHEPFDLEIDVTNNNGESVFATVRVYLCPRRDGDGVLYLPNEGRWGCIELDKFWRTLNSGSNHIVRHSADASTTVPDIPSFETLRAKTKAALESGSDLDLHEHTRACGIPNRMLLPKGKEDGMEFVLIVAITNDHADASLEKDSHGTHAQCGIHGEAYPDSRPMGFPLDRKIPDSHNNANFPNVQKTIVTVTHNAHH